MTNAIQFLESMGRNPALASLSAAGYAAAVAGLELDAQQRDALLERDPVALGALLGARPKMICSQFSPHAPREDEQEKIPDDDGQDDAPSKPDPDGGGHAKPQPQRK